MNKRFFWLAALVAVLAGISLHWAALSKAAQALSHFNAAHGAAISEDQKQSELIAAKQFQQGANVFRSGGMAAAVAGLGFLFTSWRRREPAPRLVVIVLFACYLLFQFAVV